MKRSYLLSILALLLTLCTLFTACGKSSKKNHNKKPGEELYDPPVSTDTLPIVRIETFEGEEIPTNKEEVNCTVSLESSEAAQCAENLMATIRFRGNGSMTVGKRTGKFPYKLKFNKKINMFDTGDGEAKDWVLLASVGDLTMLRNYAAKLMGEKLDGIDYSPNSRHVSVYLNGEYIGVYELTEQIEVKEHRVMINDSFTGNKNGFLVELDAYAKNPEEDDVTFMVGGNYYTVKSDVYNQAQKEYIQQYIALVDNAIKLGDRTVLESLVDMDSLVDMYLLQEFAKNIDAGYSSFYMYREVDGKLHFGPAWDFDLSFGNDARLDDGAYEELYVGTGREDFKQNHLWYIDLFSETNWFRELASERWQAISDTVVVSVINELRTVAASLEQDMEYNYTRWQFFGKKQQQEPAAIIALTTYKEHTDYLFTWMEQRKAWLDGEFSKAKDLAEPTNE